MNNSRLPVEICEHIIDSCRERQNYWLRPASYVTWRQTALVCSAWVPRSRLNLLYEVELTDASDVDLLLRTLQEAPRFADMVLRLSIDTNNKNYHSLAQMPLVLLLKNCVALLLYHTSWAKMYPSRHADRFLHPWSSRIVELQLEICSRALRTIIRFIWSLRHLQNLWLRWDGVRELRRFITKWQPDVQADKCHSLRSLKFGDAECAVFLWPVSAFGCSVRSLELDVRSGVSGNTLQCLEAFSGLERLTVGCRLEKPPFNPGISAISASSARTRTLRSVLGSVHSGSALLSLTVDVQSGYDRGSSYGVDRTGLADLLLGDEMLAILSRFPELRQLHFALKENDREHDAQWWTAEMVRRLPDSCHAAVSVQVDVYPYHDYQYLWHTREEIEAAAEEEARQRALYEDEALLADVVRMLHGDGTIYRPQTEQGVASAEQRAREGDEGDM